MFSFAADPLVRQAEFDRCRQEARAPARTTTNAATTTARARRHRIAHARRLQAFNCARKYFDAGVAEGIAPERMSIETALEAGSVGETVAAWLAAASTPKIDYVVVGSRGSGALRRFFGGVSNALGLGLGSTSDWLIHNLHLPVIVVKRPVGDPSLDAMLERLRETLPLPPPAEAGAAAHKQQPAAAAPPKHAQGRKEPPPPSGRA